MECSDVLYMERARKTFQEILEEKINFSKKDSKEFSTTRAIIEGNIPFFISNFALKIKNPLGNYPKKTISEAEKLQFWLEKCQTFEEKQAVQFFFHHGETNFINGRTLTKSFRKIALKLHPDRFSGQNLALIDQKKSEFIHLQNHYSILKKLAKTL